LFNPPFKIHGQEDMQVWLQQLPKEKSWKRLVEYTFERGFHEPDRTKVADTEQKPKGYGK
jgi:hypothetical protein